MDYSCYKYADTKIKPKKRKIKLWHKILIVLVALIFLFVILFLLVANPMIVYTAKAKGRQILQKGLTNAVLEVFDYSITYGDLVDIYKDSDGNITNISIKSLKINSLAQETVKISQSFVESLADTTVGVTLGMMTGIGSLAGLGPEIQFRLVPFGTVVANYKSVFESAGINQTRHLIYIEITSAVSIFLPISKESVEATVNIYVAENIIVGEVPAVYLSGGEKLKLTP
ncbi:MAG: sporulation protein YunB [Firmicutes bacterium]|nr:sporulation protein YunB [Bacillota bacterium]